MREKCKQCKFSNEKDETVICPECDAEYSKFSPRGMTNRQWLESLSDEEFVNVVHIRCHLTVRDQVCLKMGDCKKCDALWLKKIHKE